MEIWWMIFGAGVGTYLMRSAGVWVQTERLQLNWLIHLPFAVILVMVVSSIAQFVDSGDRMTTVAAIAATLTVILSSLKSLPLMLCVAIGCIVFGGIVGLG